jgi:hypothetical protein
MCSTSLVADTSVLTAVALPPEPQSPSPAKRGPLPAARPLRRWRHRTDQAAVQAGTGGGLDGVDHATVRRGLAVSRARLRRSLNGFRRRLSVSCVGLWRELLARTFGLAMCTLAANSLTPHGTDYLPERKLLVHALVSGRKKELAGKCRLAKVLRELDVPIFTSSCHGVCPPASPFVRREASSSRKVRDALSQTRGPILTSSTSRNAQLVSRLETPSTHHRPWSMRLRVSGWTVVVPFESRT